MKKLYKKPEITRIQLKPEEVLAACAKSGGCIKNRVLVQDCQAPPRS